MRRMLLSIALLLAACSHHSPSAPTPATESGSGPVPTAAYITFTPGELPANGGTVTVAIAVAQRFGGGLPDAHVTIATSAGTIDPQEGTTDRAGYLHATLTTDRTTDVTVRVGELEQTARVIVKAVTPPEPPPSPDPPPNEPNPHIPPPPEPHPPSPTPPAPPTPDPNPKPPFEPVMVLTATPSSLTANGGSVTLVLTIVPETPLQKVTWDFDDTTPPFDANVRTQTHTYFANATTTAQTFHPSVTIVLADGRSFSTDTAIVEAGQPVAPFFVSLAVNPSAPQPAGTNLTFTASVSGNVPSGSLTYTWDYENDGIIDFVGGSTVTHPYTVKGTPTCKVTVKGPASDPRSVSNTLQVTVQ